MRNFKVIEDDMDTVVSRRIFSGKLTKERYKMLDRFARKIHHVERCGHDFDCCGCLCGQWLEIDYKANQVTLTLTQSFNY